MEQPNITWYAKLDKEEQFEATTDFYAGTYTPSHKISVDIQVWNNRFGLKDVETLSNFYILAYFENIEDSALFDYCTVALNNSIILDLKKSGKKVILDLPDTISLSGTKNDGKLQGNESHYLNLEFVFDAEGEKLKENDLKSLFFQIVQK